MNEMQNDKAKQQLQTARAEGAADSFKDEFKLHLSVGLIPTCRVTLPVILTR